MPFTKGHPVFKGAEKGWIKKGQHLSPSTEIRKGEHFYSVNEIKLGERRSPKTEFGQMPAWNKGRKGKQLNHNMEGLTLGRGLFKGKKRPEFSGENNPRWKGGIERLRFLKKRRRALEKSAVGTHTLEEWQVVKEKFNFSCARCELVILLTEDHIIPLSKGGSDYIENIQPLCRSCNSIKHDRLEGTF